MKAGAARIVFVAQALLIGAGLTLAADVYAHKRTESVGGVNLWGYRGPVARQRQPDEIRIVFVGGTRTFGWGAAASETVPSTVRWLIMLQTDAPGSALRPVVAINLGAIGARASSYANTLEQFEYLAPDYICIYDDLGLDTSATRASTVYEMSGYAPALPLVLAEKGMALRFGSVARGYADAPHSDASGPQAVIGHLLQSAGGALQWLDRRERTPPSADEAYVDAMARAIAAARQRSARVVVAVGPATTEGQRHNLEALHAWLEHNRTDAVRLLDLTAVDALADPAATLDGYNYNGAGRVRVAEAIAPVLLQWIQQLATTDRH